MPKASDNPYPSVLVVEGTAPAAPAAGDQRVYIDSADHLLKAIDSASTVRTIGGALVNPMTTQDDIIVGGAAGAPSRLAKGTDGQVLTVDPTTHHLLWATPASGFADPTTTKGDLIVHGTTTTRLPVGTNGYVLTANSAATNGVDWEAAAASRPYLDLAVALDGTYGDDFTGASLAVKWTRRNTTLGMETYQTGGGSWMTVLPTGAAAFMGYTQTAPAGDFEIMVAHTHFNAGSNMMVGPVILDTNGTGVGACWYDDGTVYQMNITTWAYASTGQTGAASGLGSPNGTRHWLTLKKVSTGYTVKFSQDGINWSPYTASATWAGTVAYIGFGRFYNNTANQSFAVDIFNKVA